MEMFNSYNVYLVKNQTLRFHCVYCYVASSIDIVVHDI